MEGYFGRSFARRMSEAMNDMLQPFDFEVANFIVAAEKLAIKFDWRLSELVLLWNG